MFNPSIEQIPRQELEALQLERLKKALEAAQKTPFYKKQFSDNNIDITTINSLPDLRKLPFTTKSDLRLSYPDGMCAVDRNIIVRMHASSGTTGKSTVIFYTRKDIEEWSSVVARGLYSSGIRPEDVFQNMMGYGLFTGGLGLHYGAEKLGCMIIPSATGNSLKQIQLIQDFKTTAVHITPSYALHLADVINGEGINPADLGIRKAVLGAEPYSEATRDKIQEIYGLKAYNNYGLSEMNGPGVAFECEELGGMHIWEDFYIPEIINPDTGENLPDGE
ncbi:MAG TPA: AMP-binding protein, partial [Spirochaetota bacterium]|nr:AMP-binding protein [Spirochaetota bacterium]